MQHRRLFIFNNLFIAFTGVLSIIVTITIGSRGARLDGETTAYWQQIFTFTLLSNLFLSLVCTVAAIMTAFHQPLARSFPIWQLAATTATTVTLLTVLFFLAPMRAAHGKNYFDMLLEPMFFLHFFNPLLAIITYIFATGDQPTTLKSRLLATIPVIIYAAIYVVCVVVTQVWPDFYGLTFGGRYYLAPLVVLVFWLLAFASASLLTFFRHRRIGNQTTHLATNPLQ